MKIYCENCKFARWDRSISFHKFIAYCKHPSNIAKIRKEFFYPELYERYEVKNKNYDCKYYIRKWWKLYLDIPENNDLNFQGVYINERKKEMQVKEKKYIIKPTEEKKQEDLKKLLSIKGNFDARHTNNKT